MHVPAELIAPETEVEQVATGFLFTEGPNWCDAGDFLVFSDIPGDAMWRWDEAAGVRPYRVPSRMANGGMYDRSGRLVTCEHATSRVVREEADGSLTVLADRYEGAELNSPNDVVVSAGGAIDFTDPAYGRAEFFGVPRAQELPFQGLYRISAEGELELLAKDFEQPNGLCFSLDERVLYVNDTERMHIRAFDVRDDGSLQGGDVWAELSGEGPGGPDGMKLYSRGNVYCTGPGGIHIFEPGGAHLGMVATPEVVGNFAWGGRERKTIFVCASTSLYRFSTIVPGAPAR